MCALLFSSAVSKAQAELLSSPVVRRPSVRLSVRPSVRLLTWAQMETAGAISFQFYLYMCQVNTPGRVFHFVDIAYLTGFIGQSSILHVFQWKLILVIFQ